MKIGENPNCVLFDPKTKRIFTADRGSQRVSAIDPKSGKVIGTIENMGGKVEYAVADGEGHVFMNMQDRNTVVKIDAQELKVLATWPIPVVRHGRAGSLVRQRSGSAGLSHWDGACGDCGKRSLSYSPFADFNIWVADSVLLYTGG